MQWHKINYMIFIFGQTILNPTNVNKTISETIVINFKEIIFDDSYVVLCKNNVFATT